MLSRRAVLLTPLESALPRWLPFYKQNAPLSPLFATVTKSAHLYHSALFSRPLFSYSCGLFCSRAKPNSFVFKRFRTLSQKHPGWGEAHDCTSHSETPSGAPEPLVTRRISCSKILRHPVPVYGNSLSLQSLSRSARFFPANLRRQGLSRL